MDELVLELKRKGMKYDLHIDGPIGYWMTASSIREKVEEICRARGEELGEGGCGNGSANGGGCGKVGGKEVAELTVRICSPGGSLSEGLAICALFRDHGNVHAYIQGMTASAATVLAMGAKKVSMSSESVILVHNASYMLLEWEQANKERLAEKQEEYETLRRDLSTLDGVMARLYAKRSGRSEEEMSSLMTDERWLSAEEALSLGLVDEIIGDESAGEGVGASAGASVSGGVGASAGRGVNGSGVRSGVNMGAGFVRAYCASYGLPALQVVDAPRSGEVVGGGSSGNPVLEGEKAVLDGEKSVLDGEKRNFWAKLVEFFADSSNPKNRKDMENPELKAVTEERDKLQARVGELEEKEKAVTQERDALQARVNTLEEKEKAVAQERDALQARVVELEKAAKADGAETPVVEGVSGEKNDDFGNVVASAREMLKSLGEL